MSKRVDKLILWLWVGTTSLLDLSLVILALPIVAHVNANDSTFAEDRLFNQSLPVLVVNQVGISLLFLLFGILWSAIILIASERILKFLGFPTPGNNKFSRLSLALFKLALIAIVMTIVIGNISLIYDQIQGHG